MTTLHQYRWISFNHCCRFVHFIDKQDKLIIYGKFSSQDQHNLIKEITCLADRCYWLTNEQSTVAGIRNITHHQWLTLIAEHDKTYTWK